MPELNEQEMVAAAKARAEARNRGPFPDTPEAFLRSELCGGIVIPHDEARDWEKRTYLDQYPDTKFGPRDISDHLTSIRRKWREITDDWDHDPFTLVEVPYSQGRHDVMYILTSRTGEWKNRNYQWKVEHVFDPSHQLPKPEEEKDAREFLTNMGLQNLGEFITIYKM